MTDVDTLTPIYANLIRGFRERLTVRLRADMTARQAAGTLGPVADVDSTQFPFVRDWNRFVGGGFDVLDGWEQDFLMLPLLNILSRDAYRPLYDLAERIGQGVLTQAGADTAVESAVETALLADTLAEDNLIHLGDGGTFVLQFQRWVPAVKALKLA